MIDPIDAVTALGVRVIWALNLDAGIVLVDEEQLVIADADLERQHVADEVMAALTP